jgi:hypothetical protein
MNKKPIPDSSGFDKADVLATFEGAPKFFELSGPGTLVRLIQFDRLAEERRRPGRYWFEEELLVRVKNQARSELAQQQRQAGRPFAAPFDSLVTLFMRHVFRNDLAVSKDWTNHFDGYLRIRLLPGDKLIALAGPAKRQAAYSEKHPQHDVVVAKEIWLEGQAVQYVIDFRFPANQPYVPRAIGPLTF